MKRRSAWGWALVALLCGVGCSKSPTDETQTDEEAFKQALAAMSVSVADVSEEGGERMLNPLTILTGQLKEDYTYHLDFDFQLKTGDTGRMILDVQFTDNGEPIPVPTALNDDPILNIDGQFTGTFKGAPVTLDVALQLRTPKHKQVTVTGGGTLHFADLMATFNTSDLAINFNLTPLPFGSIALTVSQPDFGNWTGSVSFSGTPAVHVVVGNGARTFDLTINLLTGEIT